MAYEITKMDVWAGEVADQPGGLAGVLEALAGAGAGLECVIARRQPDKAGKGVVFLTPVKGKKLQDAARKAGMAPAANIATLRVEAPDRAGAGAALTKAIADAGVNVRGVSAAKVGGRSVAYFGFDSADDAAKAAKAIKALDKAKPAKKAKK